MKHINVKCLLLAVVAWGLLSPAALANAALTEAPHPGIVGCRPFGGSPSGKAVPAIAAARVTQSVASASGLPITPPKGGEPLRFGVGAFKKVDVLVYDPADFSDEEGKAILAVFTKELRERLYKAVPLLDDASCGMVEVGKLLLDINKGLAARFSLASAKHKERVDDFFADVSSKSRIQNRISSSFADELNSIDLSSSGVVEPRRVRTAVSAYLVLMVARNYACEVWRRESEAELRLRPVQPVLLLSERDGQPCFELLPRKPLAREDEEFLKEHDAKAETEIIEAAHRAVDVSFSCLERTRGAFGRYIREASLPVGSEDRASARERLLDSLKGEQFPISAKMFGVPAVRVPVLSIDALMS